MKTEMRGHDNRLECAVFVPQASIPAVRELVALVIPTAPPIFLLRIADLMTISHIFSQQMYNLRKWIRWEFPLF
jgi:platelet-activating factor acetylhydrolase IB subunit alpha